MIKEIDRNMKWIGRLFLLALSVWLGGCQSEDNSRFSGKTGLLITLTDEADQAYSRTAPSELEDPLSTMFELRVVDAATKKVAYSGRCEEFILLKEGTYNLTATYGENPVIALDAPYYVGTLEGQRVVTGQETSATVSCAVANALLSVNYNEESLKKAYEDYSVTVSVDDQSVEIDSTGEKSAYFQANSSVKLVFRGRLAGTGKDVSYDIPEPEGGVFSNIPAKKHVKVTLGTDGNVSSGVGISVEKLEVTTVSLTETLPLDFLPKPKISSADFVNNELSFAETETKSAVINLNLSSPLQDLKLKFNSADAKFAGLEDGKEYQLSNAGDKAAVKAALGITLPEIGATEGSLDFSSLTPQLMTDAGNTVSSTIEVDVKANNRWASEDKAANRVFTLKCNKPIFHVSVYPGNIWTKEFTMNPLIAEEVEAGNYELLSQKMTYQFSMDGETGWTNLGDDLRKADLQPGGTYYVRGVYRGVINSEAVAVTTYPVVELENGNLSDYSIVRGEDGNRWNGHGAQYEWTGWATLNEMTTPNCPITSYSYNTRSGTRPISDVRPHSEDNTAVWIITMGYGYGGTDSEPKNVTPSELFLGTYNTKGIDFKSHPTGVHFWYKYFPYSGDSSDIYIQVYSGEQLIGSAALKEVNNVQSYTECTLNILYEDKYINLSPDKISLVFKSGFNTEVESREEGGLISANSANPKFRGSELYIDDISLVYDK